MTETSEAAKRLAVAVVRFGLQPTEYRALTLREWNAIVAEWQRANKRK